MRHMRFVGPIDGPRHHHHHRGGPGGPRGRGMRGGPRAGRGDVRAAILLLLAEEPRNGYGLMQEIETRTDGVWRPSPGSVYPTLSQLEDEGLIKAQDADRGRVFVLTDTGTAKVAERDAEAQTPWDAVAAGRESGGPGLRGSVMELGAAARQVSQVGTTAQVEAAAKIMADARKAIYALLAGDDTPAA